MLGVRLSRDQNPPSLQICSQQQLWPQKTQLMLTSQLPWLLLSQLQMLMKLLLQPSVLTNPR